MAAISRQKLERHHFAIVPPAGARESGAGGDRDRPHTAAAADFVVSDDGGHRGGAGHRLSEPPRSRRSSRAVPLARRSSRSALRSARAQAAWCGSSLPRESGVVACRRGPRGLSLSGIRYWLVTGHHRQCGAIGQHQSKACCFSTGWQLGLWAVSAVPGAASREGAVTRCCGLEAAGPSRWRHAVRSSRRRLRSR